ncbi:SRPBCC family protein [Saprospiraceae bacterium]|nr:SRPBCC family protein [Saprospiraceae bacterium]
MTEQVVFSKTGMMIRKPIAEVFNAFVDPDVTTKFWFTHSTGKLAIGNKVTWSWKMYNVEAPVEVLDLIENEKILISWGEGEQKSTVEWKFQSLADQKTYVTIINSDFQVTGTKLTVQLIDSTGGFTLVVAGLKAWLEHGIQLNLVGDKFPIELTA